MQKNAIVLSLLMLASCSLLPESEEELAAKRAAPPDTEGPKATVTRELTEAQAALDSASLNFHTCIVDYANKFALSATNPSDIVQAATSSCNGQSTQLRQAVQYHIYAQSNYDLRVRGQNVPSSSEMISLADRVVELNVADAQGQALDLIVRARAP